MSDIFEEYDPLKGKTFCILDESGTFHDEHAPEFSEDELKTFYRWIVFSRVADQKALNLQRQGRFGTYAPVLGQEAIQAGSALAMDPDDWVVPSYRELLVSLVRGVPLVNLYIYWMGNEKGMHMPEGVNVFPISVPVGTQPLHAVGAAWAAKLQKKKIAVTVYFGDGATSEGDFHEAMNFAGVFNTPNVFICQNNQYAISVPLKKQTAAKTLAQKAIAYGFPGIRIDGNDILASYVATKAALDRAHAGKGPSFIEAVTYRLGVHTTADDPTRYRTDEEVEEKRKYEPLMRLDSYLREKGILDDDLAEQVKTEAEKEVAEAVEKAEAESAMTADEMFQHMFEEMTPALKEQLKALKKELSAKEEVE